MNNIPVIVQEYSPLWEEQFKAEAKVIESILGRRLVGIHHIGSTAVKGLWAKPIIDIMPVVRSIATVDECSEAFANAGYEALGEFGISGRRYFRKGPKKRTHQVHIFEESNLPAVRRHLAVRDYLRAHKEAAEEYGALKRKLARKFPADIQSYMAGKDAFVKDLEKKALSWYLGT
ncbi:MAG TPA: GrpB family protein [Firmicutes bacterium]|nr:GrpB family protein [Bacillota bacterium]